MATTANPFNIPSAGVSADNPLAPEYLALERQKRIAELLMNKSQQAPEGQMVSGHYVAPSLIQQLNPLFNAYSGSKMAGQNEAKTAELAQMLRGQGVQEINTFSNLMQKDPQSAYKYAATAVNPQLQKLGFDKMLPQDIKLGAEETYTRLNPNGTTEVLAKGQGKAHVVGNSLIVDGKAIYTGEEKPVQVDTGTAIQYREAKTGKVLWETPKHHVFAPHAPQLIETADGFVQFNPTTGSVTAVKSSNGEPLMGKQGLTEAQGNATAYGIRMLDSNRIINELAAKGVYHPSRLTSLENMPVIGGSLGSTVNMLPNNVMGIPTGGQSADQQSLLAAKRNFVTAVLRKESGAAISPSEFATEDLKYFPQRGDSQQVIDQKADARELAIKAMKIQAGPGAKQVVVQTPKNKDGIPNGVTKEQWDVMTPEEKKAFK
jgi:hypothetical protein